MRVVVKAGLVAASFAAVLSATTAFAWDGARADFRSQQSADQRAFTATPHNGVQQRTFATRQMMERRTFGTAQRGDRGDRGQRGERGGQHER